MNKILLSGGTDVGLKRSKNEDTFIASLDYQFCLVADGMGGAAAGELASRFFAETCFQIFSNAEVSSEKQLTNVVQKAFSMANKRILEHVKTAPHHEGMGCTAELLAFTNGSFVLGHMGDSRTYRFRDKELRQLTHDHSLVQNMVDQGLLTPAEAKVHAHRNVILRAVGIDENLSLDLIRGRIQTGDIFLLCSDGLTDMVDDSLIKEVVSSNLTLPKKVEGFIELARMAGGSDNITVVLSHII